MIYGAVPASVYRFFRKSFLSKCCLGGLFRIVGTRVMLFVTTFNIFHLLEYVRIRHKTPLPNYARCQTEFQKITFWWNKSPFTQIYVPSMMVVFLSWMNFWIDIEAVAARISLGLLTVLTTSTQVKWPIDLSPIDAKKCIHTQTSHTST